MSDGQTTPKTGVIDWRFQVVEQGQTARYGQLGDLFYKQYLPAGLVLDRTHPPKRISEALYLFALRRYNRANPQSASG
jgi:hypothetical protein